MTSQKRTAGRGLGAGGAGGAGGGMKLQSKLALPGFFFSPVGQGPSIMEEDIVPDAQAGRESRHVGWVGAADWGYVETWKKKKKTERDTPPLPPPPPKKKKKKKKVRRGDGRWFWCWFVSSRASWAWTWTWERLVVSIAIDGSGSVEPLVVALVACAVRGVFGLYCCLLAGLGSSCWAHVGRSSHT